MDTKTYELAKIVHEKLSFIGGAGLLGLGMVKGLLAAEAIHPDNIMVTARTQPSLDRAARWGVRCSLDNRDAVKFGRLVLLCVQPADVEEVLLQIREDLVPEQVILSFAAGITTARLEKVIGREIGVIRVMPNTAVSVRSSMTTVVTGKWATPDQVRMSVGVLKHLGEVEILPEKLMNAATAVGGCAPAFIFRIIDALIQGGIKAGLPRDSSRRMSVQAVLGAALMVKKSELHPAALRDEVTTPGGCTIDGLAMLEKHGAGIALIEAVEVAARKAGELAEEE